MRTALARARSFFALLEQRSSSADLCPAETFLDRIFVIGCWFVGIKLCRLACSSLILVVGAGLVRVFAHVEGRAHVLARVRTTNACGFPGFLPLFAARNDTTDDDQQSDDDTSLQFHVSRPQE